MATSTTKDVPLLEKRRHKLELKLLGLKPKFYILQESKTYLN